MQSYYKNKKLGVLAIATCVASLQMKSNPPLSPCVAGFHHMCIPLAVYCVIRRVSPTNSKFHPLQVDLFRSQRI